MKNKSYLERAVDGTVADVKKTVVLTGVLGIAGVIGFIRFMLGLASLGFISGLIMLVSNSDIVDLPTKLWLMGIGAVCFVLNIFIGQLLKQEKQ